MTTSEFFSFLALFFVGLCGVFCDYPHGNPNSLAIRPSKESQPGSSEPQECACGRSGSRPADCFIFGR
jgi:hypothetical protein